MEKVMSAIPILLNCNSVFFKQFCCNPLLTYLRIQGGSSTGRCYRCGDEIHWRSECPWLNFPCVNGCGETMKLYTSNVPRSKGEKLFRCNGQFEGCKGFKRLRDAIADKEAIKKERTLKLTIHGVVPMSVEGEVSDITELVKKLSIAK
ncbi:hypothetical protein ACHQM5_019402 [Ranunculus cassubicifolius]